MSYYINELKSIIKNSNITKIKIAENCDITSSAISKVLSEKQEPFSREINEKICETCEKDKRLLNIARGLDLVGIEFFELLDILKQKSIQAFQLQYPDEDIEKVNKLYDTSLPQFIIYLIQSYKFDNTELEKVDYPTFVVSDKQSVILKNDKMEPYIHENSKIYLDFENKNYKKDDIVCVILSDNNFIIGILDMVLEEKIKISFINIKQLL